MRPHPALLATALALAPFQLPATGRPPTQTPVAPGAPRPPNILFLAIDDLRSDLATPGHAPAITPCLDALAASGRRFSHHYVQVPTCGASRCSLLRGRYPDRPAHLGNGSIAETHADWAGDSLPACFQRAGYQTLALGKVTHHPGGLTGPGWATGPEELPGVWNRSWVPDTPWPTPEALMHGYANGRPRQRGVSPPIEAFDGPDPSHPDAWIADEAIRTLASLAGSGTPWFLVVGLFKPHLPFAAPRKWFDLHDPAHFPKPTASHRPTEPAAWHASGEFRANYGHAGRDPDTDPAYASELRHAYAAAVSYMDAQAGRILDALHHLGLADNTLVVAWSDHGFLLGEHGIWGKHCLYEPALRSPLILRIPHQPLPGRPSPALVESVDIFPTLLDLCGVPGPGSLDGRSLRPQLLDPDAPSGKPALGFWTGDRRTVRTQRWRYVVHGDGTEQLFDHESDPHEARNIAADPSHHDALAALRTLASRR